MHMGIPHVLRIKFRAPRFLNQISRLPVPHWIQIRLTVIYTYMYIVAFCCGDPTLRTTQMLTCIIPTFDGIYFIATVDRSAGSLLYPKAPKQGCGCSQKSKSIYMYIYIYRYIIIYIFILIYIFFLCIYVCTHVCTLQPELLGLGQSCRFVYIWNLQTLQIKGCQNIVNCKQFGRRKETCVQSLWWHNVW